MKNIAIIGSGGQCRAILGVLSTLDLVKPIVIYDLNEPFEDESIMGISVKKSQQMKNYLKVEVP